MELGIFFANNNGSNHQPHHSSCHSFTDYSVVFTAPPLIWLFRHPSARKLHCLIHDTAFSSESDSLSVAIASELAEIALGLTAFDRSTTAPPSFPYKVRTGAPLRELFTANATLPVRENTRRHRIRPAHLGAMQQQYFWSVQL
jgi:hypothetical protein